MVRFEIDTGNPLIGFALSSARKGEELPVVYREFTSTEDGQHFINRLENLPLAFIDGAPSPVRRSQVDNLLAMMHPDGKGTIHLNELEIDLLCRTRGSVRKGAEVYTDDIADIEGLNLSVGIPDDAGFVFIFSVGWRKGMFFYFGPLRPGGESRDYDTSTALGRCVAHVLFQERFAITEQEWAALFEEMWFPFVGLRDRTKYSLLNHVRSGWKCDDMLDEIVAEVKGQVDNMLRSWRDHRAMSTHIEFLERAVERFLEDDSISCTSILFPRIEGIVRIHSVETGNLGNPRQSELADLAVAAKVENERSLLLPLRFRAYLEDVYFANFNLPKGEVPLSRNSVGHGVASASDVDLKSAVLGLLIVHQISFFLQR